MISEKTIERISLYRRLLQKLQHQHSTHVYSHQLSALTHCSSAQIRRDLMLIGISGSSSRGYAVADLIQGINKILDASTKQDVVLVGIGNLGRALLSYFPHRSPNYRIVGAFDVDSAKTNRLIHGCRTYHLSEFPKITKVHKVSVGIISVPAEKAQNIADMMVEAGIRGIINFAPIPLRVPVSVFVEHLDMTMSLDKVAYFARQNNS